MKKAVARKASRSLNGKHGVSKLARKAPTGTRKLKEARRPARPARTRKVKPAMKRTSKPDQLTRPTPVPTSSPGGGIIEPITSNTKPKKNLAGLNSKELEHYRDLLLAKRRELVGDMSSMELEALRTGGTSNLSNLPIHMADMGTDNYEQEFTLGLMEKDRNLLREINVALGKIQNGTYGLCEGSGKPIGKPRLEAQPWARFSIEHARKLENRSVR